LALIADIRGDATEALLFRRAAALVRDHDVNSDADLAPLLSAAPLETSDLDREAYRRLQHMYDAGAWVLMESAIADLPADLRWLFESGSVTIEQLAAIHQHLGAMTAADLAAASERRALHRVPGLDSAVEEAIIAALPSLRTPIPRIPLGRAMAMIEPILARLRLQPGVQWASPVGSLRRGQDTVGDVEIVAAADDPSAAIEDLSRLPDIARILHRSTRRLYLLMDRVQLGIRFPELAVAGASLLYLTGARAHLDALRLVARDAGGKLMTDGYQPPRGGPVVAANEEAIYTALGLPFIPPEIRNGDGEVEAARAGLMPQLVSTRDIRGDLHMHSRWSDGRDSVEEMAAACQSLGYEYFAITDHSPHSAATRNLSIDDVQRQADEIAALRGQFPDITILHGCEVDILADGGLDLPDRVLELLDIVLASLHDRRGHSAAALLNRYASAMRHPLVNVITHPTNRLVPTRPGYDLDYDRLFEIAVETGTILEIDGAPVHLDMDAVLARRAVAAGVMVAIDSDSHRSDAIERQMQLGVTTARRGWVEPRHVVNARSVAEIRALIARKRNR
jgi:DNA polymerase (family 10)